MTDTLKAIQGKPLFRFRVASAANERRTPRGNGRMESNYFGASSCAVIARRGRAGRAPSCRNEQSTTFNGPGSPFCAGQPPSKTAPTRGRGGYALVELMVVISVNTVLMAVAVGLIGTLLGTEHQGRRHFEKTNSLVQLTDQWRSDVAVSRTATVVTPNRGESQTGPQIAVLRLQNGEDDKIEFSRDGDRLRRIEYHGPAIVRREAYVLSHLAEADFSMSEARLVTLRLAFGDGKSVARDVWQIDARLARDGRFAGSQTSTEKPQEKP